MKRFFHLIKTVLDTDFGQQGGAGIFSESLYISNSQSYCGSVDAAL